MIRLDTKGIKIAKYLAECGIASRRKCEELVEAGKVIVNGHKMTNVAERIDPERDIVEYAGKRVQAQRKMIFALHKPRGHVSTLSDPHAGPTIAELIPDRYSALGLVPVGRLDKESEGLMLMTNDGELAYRLMHPKFNVVKIYRVKLDKPVEERIMGVIRKGPYLPAEGKLRPMGVKVVGKGTDAASELELTLREGRKHEIRNVFAMFGYKVLKLQRIAIGSLKLGSIRKGHLVKLTESQAAKLYRDCGMTG
jgi:23S rRNA pseudouridine2605 synthase